MDADPATRTITPNEMPTVPRPPAPCRANAPIRAARARRIACASLVAALAFAGAGTPLARAADEAGTPSVELRASASSQVANDEMVVRLSAQASGTDMGTLNEQVLASLKAALDKSKAVSGVSARLGSVTTQPEWGPQGKRTGWRVQGSLVLESADMAALGALAGRLGAELSIDSVEFRLTAARRSVEENRLLREAADAFRERAAKTASAFGYAGYELRRLSVLTQGVRPPPPMPMAAMARATGARSDLPAEGGVATVEVSIEGSVSLTR